jgi:drug/metabolite transporter (DMT)-like permease
MTNDPYPTILPSGLGVILSLAMNFGAPAVAWLISRKLGKHRWWPHAAACFWQIISVFVFVILLLPAYPPGESPGPGEGFLLVPTALSAVVVLLGYCIVLLYKFVRWL